MARVKRGMTAHRRHRKVIKQAQGYWGRRHNLFKTAKEAVMHAGRYAYRDRRQRKRDMRQLWIARINAGTRALGVPYSRFIAGLKAAGIEVDRKVISDLAITDAAAFTALVHAAKAALDNKAAL